MNIALWDRSGAARSPLSVRRRHQTGHADGRDDEANAATAAGVVRAFYWSRGVARCDRANPSEAPGHTAGSNAAGRCGLAIVMIGATVYTFAAGQVASALIPLVVGILCAFVAYGRWRAAP